MNCGDGRRWLGNSAGPVKRPARRRGGDPVPSSHDAEEAALAAGGASAAESVGSPASRDENGQSNMLTADGLGARCSQP